ncbi:MAG: S46 family peptidase [Bradymonadia bacterium]
MGRFTRLSLSAAFATLALGGTASAEEGMWPYNMAPVDQIKAGHGFELTDQFLDRAMKASVRFNNGGSGSFVSADGLVMTNHHVGADCIQKLSQGERDVMADGYLAKDAAGALKCPDLELNQLQSIADVTEVLSAIDDVKARKARMSALEKACADETGLRCDVVTLYAGGAYHLYRYRKYTDVRLVFAPEFKAAFFGGDPDNFTFPRTCLDVAFFRVFDKDAPIKSPDHLPFSKDGAAEGDLVFVSGNPGSTGRFDTPAKLTHLQSLAYPFVLEQLKHRAATFKAFMDKGPEQHRAGRDAYFGIMNAIKAITGYLGGLNDPALIAEVRKRHDAVKAQLKAMPEEKLSAAERTRLLEAWGALAKAYTAYGEFYKIHAVTEGWLAPRSSVLRVARTLLRLNDELEKPSGARLREFRDSNLESVELRLFSPAPIDDGFETVQIALGLQAMVDVLGADHAAVKAALDGMTPQARAEAVVKGTAIKSVDARKQMLADGAEKLAAAKDPAIELVRAYDALARELRSRHEQEVEAVERKFAGRIAEAWALAYGQGVYPDATFTLRLNHGVIKGYSHADQTFPWHTTMADVFAKSEKYGNADPYTVSDRWLAAKGKLDPKVPFNIVSTNDIIGGNSGSPMFDTKGQVVGLIFDGNLQQLPNRFLYRDTAARSISVDVRAITHALDVVYGAEGLLKELGVK